MFIEFRRRLTMNIVTRVVVIAIATVLAGARSASAQAGADIFTLDRAMQYAVEHYPAVRAAVEQVAAAMAGVSVARAAYCRGSTRCGSRTARPRTTSSARCCRSRSCRLSPVPCCASTSSQSVWGSATGALFTWEPVDFGLRKAAVAGAEAAVAQARAGEALTRLEVRTRRRRRVSRRRRRRACVVAAQADVDRRDALARTVRALVDNQLRPGADASRADAERAAAQTRLIQAQQTLAVAQTMLARVLGVGGGRARRRRESARTRTPEGWPACRAWSSPRIRWRRRGRRRSMPRSRSSRCCRAPICRGCTCSRASSRAAAARTRTARSTAARTVSASSARTGRQAFRSSFRTCSISPACTRGRRRPRPRPRRDGASMTRRC